MSMSKQVAQQLPYLRRYARALTGSQTTGDRYAAATLEAILADCALLSTEIDVKTALFRAFHTVWQTTGTPITEQSDEQGVEGRAQSLLGTLTPHTREALLLRSLEQFSYQQIGQIIDVSGTDAQELVAIAYSEMNQAVRGKVLVIEDEPLIALDISHIVTDMGHEVTAIARTRSEAVRHGLEQRPDLILADIHLADDSSGIDAVNDLLKHDADTPVIFITAYPERLLTGEKPEPAFLITKPFESEQVRSAVSQAMFFASTQTLNA
ncbi:response regulator receiver protein [Roseicitreum antarcticum]|uniref:Response regulator receiver protein n=2 Tax=Roseicitreum antarcticum TaxID=564137 RepID=A0A1H2ZCG8_9RHOB|nr:response regulator [Roseicitreum antarcticum]SDX15035.1 response regulator receiver protein [Roseicitreum antarcticum]